MRRIRLAVALLMLLLAGAAATGAYRLLHTEAGLQWALAQLVQAVVAQLQQ